jgi:tetratricopeptide (TPR) repeat protein
MRTAFRRLVVLLAVLVLLTGRAAAQNDQCWLGREVLVRAPDVKLKVGSRVVGTAPDATVLRVQQVQGQWLWVGTGWVQASDVVPLEDAVAFFTKQIESAPSISSYLSRAEAYLSRGNYLLALIDLRRTSKRVKKLEMLSTALAENAADEKPLSPDVAKKLLKVADDLVKSTPEGYSLRAEIYRKLERWDDEITDLTSAMLYEKTDPMPFDMRASAWEKKGDFARALADLDQAIRLDTKEAYHFSRRAFLRLELGQDTLALQDVAEASRLEPEEPLYYRMQAHILAISGSDGVRDGKRAVDLATKACELSHWRDPGDLFVLGAAYAESSDFESAISCEAKSLELYGRDASFRQASQLRQELYRRKIPFHNRFATNVQSGTQKR